MDWPNTGQTTPKRVPVCRQNGLPKYKVQQLRECVLRWLHPIPATSLSVAKACCSFFTWPSASWTALRASGQVDLSWPWDASEKEKTQSKSKAMLTFWVAKWPCSTRYLAVATSAFVGDLRLQVGGWVAVAGGRNAAGSGECTPSAPSHSGNNK